MLGQISDEYVRGDLATILAKEARRLSPEQAVRVMTDALMRNPSSSSSVPCGEGIAAVSQASPPNGAPKRVAVAAVLPMRSTRATDEDASPPWSSSRCRGALSQNRTGHSDSDAMAVPRSGRRT